MKVGTRKEGGGAHQIKARRNFETLQSDFDKLEAKDRLLFMERLIRHILPNPLHELERLTDQQLDEIISRLKNQHQNMRVV